MLMRLGSFLYHVQKSPMGRSDLTNYLCKVSETRGNSAFSLEQVSGERLPVGYSSFGSLFQSKVL